jgi:hypothetical protein
LENNAEISNDYAWDSERSIGAPMLDVFMGNLRSPSCGKDPPPDADTSMQTYIRGLSADGSCLGVGFRFEPNDLTTDSILESGYTLIKEPGTNFPIRILDIWACPSCNTDNGEWPRSSIGRFAGSKA